jgi:hypothetical protein
MARKRKLRILLGDFYNASLDCLCSLFVDGDAEKLPTLIRGKVSIPRNDLKVAFHFAGLLSESGLIEAQSADDPQFPANLFKIHYLLSKMRGFPHILLKII